MVPASSLSHSITRPRHSRLPAPGNMRELYATEAKLHESTEMRIRHRGTFVVSTISIAAQAGLVSAPSCGPAGPRPQQREMAIGTTRWQTGGGESRRNTAGGAPHQPLTFHSVSVAENSLKHCRSPAPSTRFCRISSGAGFIKLPWRQKQVTRCVCLLIKYEKLEIPLGQNGVPPYKLRAGSAWRAEPKLWPILFAAPSSLPEMSSRTEASPTCSWPMLSSNLNVQHARPGASLFKETALSVLQGLCAVATAPRIIGVTGQHKRIGKTKQKSYLIMQVLKRIFSKANI